jgi:hypothetical protein
MDSKWFKLAAYLVPLVLSQHPKTAPIADEVAAAVAEAEGLFGSGSGASKLAHVVNVAKEAAQAVDELRGSEDETAGAVSAIVNATVPLINALNVQLSPKATVDKA